MSVMPVSTASLNGFANFLNHPEPFQVAYIKWNSILLSLFTISNDFLDKYLLEKDSKDAKS